MKIQKNCIILHAIIRFTSDFNSIQHYQKTGEKGSTVYSVEKKNIRTYLL